MIRKFVATTTVTEKLFVALNVVIIAISVSNLIEIYKNVNAIPTYIIYDYNRK